MDSKFYYLLGVAGISLFVISGKYTFTFGRYGFSLVPRDSWHQILNSRTSAEAVKVAGGIISKVLDKKNIINTASNVVNAGRNQITNLMNNL